MVTAADVYTVAVGDWQVGPQQTVTTFDRLSISEHIDNGWDMSFSIIGNSATGALLTPFATDVFLFRAGTLIQRFRVIDAPQEWGDDGSNRVQVTAVDYKRLLNNRHVQSTLEFVDEPQATLIWAMIQHTQAQPGGDLGITAGSVSALSTPRTRTYEPGENIGKELNDLSGVIDGPYWEIVGDRVLNVGGYTFFPVRYTPVQLGSTARRIKRKAGAFANSVWVDGDSAFTVPVVADAPDILTDPRGRWERVAGFPTVKLQDTLDEKASGLVADSRSPGAQWTCELEPSRFLTDADFSPGQYVTIVVPPDVADAVGGPGALTGGQVISRQYTVGADGDASVTIEVIEI